MCVKLSLRNLNHGPYPHTPHLTSTYTCEMTIAPRICGGKSNFFTHPTSFSFFRNFLSLPLIKKKKKYSHLFLFCFSFSHPTSLSHLGLVSLNGDDDSLKTKGDGSDDGGWMLVVGLLAIFGWVVPVVPSWSWVVCYGFEFVFEAWV